MRQSTTIFGSVVFALTLSACGGASGGAGGNDYDQQGTPGGGGANGGEEPGAGNQPGTGGKLNLGGDTGSGSTSGCYGGTDADKDGFSTADGDCNDCDPNANPGALDVAGNSVDEDCNGTPDDEATDCDVGLNNIGDMDAMNAAKALGICRVSDGTTWGVVKAQYVRADGTPGVDPRGHALLDNWGPNVNVQEGGRMLVLSSGTARRPNDPGYESPSGAYHDDGAGNDVSSPQPPGFPIDTPACPGVTTGGDANDPAALELRIKVPTNAKSFKYLFDFYTFEYPTFICSTFNDFFVALQNPPPPNAIQGNISFDSQGNPVSVNNGFLEVCQPQLAGGKNFTCPLGDSQLMGTGFDDSGWSGPHAATGWLETTSPVEPGSTITIRFAVYDVGDHILDSTVLIDGFQFSAEEATGSVTNPVPVPQ